MKKDIDEDMDYSEINPLLPSWHGDIMLTGVAQWIFYSISDHTILDSIVQQPLHAKTPSHTSFSVFQMLLILLQVESKQDVSTSSKYIQIPNCFPFAAGQDD
jgi:hypothetical protein